MGDWHRQRPGHTQHSSCFRCFCADLGTGCVACAMGASRDKCDASRSCSREHIIVMTRYPVPGSCKTRLMPTLGPNGCAELQRAMTERILQSATQYAVHSEGPVSIEIRYSGKCKADIEAWLGSGMEALAVQCPLHYTAQASGKSRTGVRCSGVG